MSVLAVKALNQFYGGSHTLWDVDLAVPAGSRTCLMGRNGMGKTTLLKCIMGLLRVDVRRDHVRRDRAARGCRPRARARLGIGYVPQGREIFSQLTVEENLRVGLGVRKNGARTIPPQIFELFPVLKQMLQPARRRPLGRPAAAARDRPRARARADAADPRRADRRHSAEHRPRDRRHHPEAQSRKPGVTVLLVEQKLPFARRVASEFRILEKGRCVAGGAIAELTDDVVRAHLSV